MSRKKYRDSPPISAGYWMPRNDTNPVSRRVEEVLMQRVLAANCISSTTTQRV